MLNNSSRASVSIAFVREVLHSIEVQGMDADSVRTAAGISPALLQRPQARVSAESFGQLWLAAAAALDDEFFGLDARRMKVGTYAALCRHAIRCANLGDALHCIAEWLNLILDESRLELLESGRQAVLQINDTPRTRPLTARNRVFAHETLLVMVFGLACWLIDRRIPLHKVQLAYPRPTRAPEYDAMFAPGACFEAGPTSLIFAASALEAPLVQDKDSLHAFLAQAPANFITRYRNDNSPATRIRRQLQAMPPDQWPDFSTLAAQMEVAPSTLHRRLAREGARFGSIRDDLRRDYAIRLLSEGHASGTTIAEKLGFSEAAAFYRAFRKWTGARPGDYRPGLSAAADDTPHGSQ